MFPYLGWVSCILIKFIIILDLTNFIQLKLRIFDKFDNFDNFDNLKGAPR